MSKTIKRVLSMVVALVMVLSMVPAGAFHSHVHAVEGDTVSFDFGLRSGITAANPSTFLTDSGIKTGNFNSYHYVEGTTTALTYVSEENPEHPEQYATLFAFWGHNSNNKLQDTNIGVRGCGQGKYALRLEGFPAGKALSYTFAIDLTSNLAAQIDFYIKPGNVGAEEALTVSEDTKVLSAGDGKTAVKSASTTVKIGETDVYDPDGDGIGSLILMFVTVGDTSTDYRGYVNAATFTELACEHKWNDATCQEDRICSVCGQTDGVKGDHNYVKANEFAIGVCEHCGQKEQDSSFRIGDVYYSSLQAAVNAVQDGNTITVSSSVSITEKAEVPGFDNTEGYGLVINAHKSFTIAMGGKTLVLSTPKGIYINTSSTEEGASEKKVTIQIGTVKGQATCQELIVVESAQGATAKTALNLNTLDLVVNASNGVGVTLKDADVVFKPSQSGRTSITNNAGGYNVLAQGDSHVDITTAAISKDKTFQYVTELYVTGEGKNVHLENGAAATVERGIFSHDTAALLETGYVSTYYEEYNAGSESTPKMKYNVYVVNACTEHTYDQKVMNEDTKISGATCTAAAKYYYSCSCGDISTTETFTDGEALEHSFTKYVYNNNATFDADGTETAKCDNCEETHTRTAEGTQRTDAKAQIGTAKYGTLQEAIDAANDGETIVLLDNNAIGTAMTTNVKSLTIDLGGKTLSVAAPITVSAGDTLKITGEGSLVVNAAIAVDGTLDLYDIGYGATGLVPGQSGNLAIGANGKVVFMAVWANQTAELLNNYRNTFFYGSTVGAKAQLGEKVYNLTEEGWVIEGAVASIDREYNGQAYSETYASLADAIADAKDGETVKLLADVEVTSSVAINKNITLDLGEYNITRTTKDSSAPAILVSGANATITGTTGTVTASGPAVWAYSGNVTIEGGNYVGGNHAVYANGTSDVVIKKGKFSITDGEGLGYVLNVLDKDRATAKITVNGGEFVNFNPYKNGAEGKNTNFLAKDLHASADENGVYTIHKCVIAVLDAVAPNCENTGLTEGKKCTECGEILVEQEVVDALGHNHVGTVTEPTCTEQGYTTYTCACGDTYIADYVAAKDHSFGEWYTVNPATCTADGLEQRDCANCTHSETNVLTQTGHNHVGAVTEPTCTEQGYTTYTCACGDTYIADYVAAKDHSFGEWYTVNPATCTADGLEQRDCANCDHFETNVLTQTGHNHVGAVTEPTCTEQGYTTYTCACGDTYVDDYVDALDHSFTEYVYNNNATTTADGTETATCDNGCGLTDTRVAAGTKLEETVVAKNENNGKTYATLAETLAEAANGDTVTLMMDVTEMFVSVMPGVTLNLNGKTLTATMVYALGEVKGGTLAVPKNNVRLDGQTAENVPLWNGEGYVFAAITEWNVYMWGGKLWLQPIFDAKGTEILKNGAAAAGITIRVAVSWKSTYDYTNYTDIYDSSATGIYTSDYQNGPNITVKDADSLNELKYTVQVVTAAGAVFECEPVFHE